MKRIDLCGTRFGKLTAIDKAPNDSWGSTRWLCKCDCGKSTITRSSRLISGWSTSCGCALRRQGESHHLWKGGRIVNKQGYCVVYITSNHWAWEMAQKKDKGRRYILEHRLVMAMSLGRHLLPGETVHHINGDRSDNRIENLQLRQGGHGKGTVFICGDCGSTNIQPQPLH